MSSQRMLQPKRIRFYVGVRDGKRVSVYVDGQVDEAGAERISAQTARQLDTVFEGGPYRHLDYVEEPIASTETPVVSQETSRPGRGLLATVSSVPAN